MTDIRGVYVVLVTPFTKDKQVDFEGLRQNVHWLVQQGVHGLIPLGSTGEFASLEEEDKRKVIDTVVEASGGKLPIVAGATAETTEKAIANARYAKEAGASGVLVLPPYYYTPDQDEIFDHYRRISDSVDIPIMVYNNPFSSKVDIQAETIARLAKLDRVVCVKESTGDIKRITEIRTRTQDGIRIFCGWEDMAYESFLMGCEGWVCVIGNILPRESARLFDLVVVQKDYAEGWRLYQRMLPILRYLEYAGKTQKSLKHVLDGMGLAGGYSSSPKLPLDPASRMQIDALLREFKGGDSIQ
jgi:4-hydroxy-tetrahydrodipicolinate synthase